MTRNHVPVAVRRAGLEEMLTDEVGYHRLIQWLASLDPEPLRRALDLPGGALTIQREVAVDDTCRLDLVVYVDDIPAAVAQVTLGLPTRVDHKWVYDQWCTVRGILPAHRHVLSLTGDVIAAWSAAPAWQTSTSILSLLATWRDTSRLVFVRELAKHAHALAEEIVLQARGTLAHLETGIARSLVAQRLRVAFRERYLPGSGIEFPIDPVDHVHGVRASLWAPVGADAHTSLHVEPHGGAHAKPGCAWSIIVLAAALGERLAGLPVPTTPVPTLVDIRGGLETLGLHHLTTRLTLERLPPDGGEIVATFRSPANPSIRRWRERFRADRQRLATTRRVYHHHGGAPGAGVRIVVDNSLTVDELQTVALVVAEMLRTFAERATASAASTGPDPT